MIRAMLIFVLLLLLPSSVVAQQTSPQVLKHALAKAEESASEALVVRDHTRVSLAAAVQGPVSTPDTRKRQPSMVGYIDEATVRSQVRLRYDFGVGTETPDLAEFFYAKCGCFRLGPADNPNLDPEAPGPFETGVVTNLEFQQVYLQGEFALSDRFSVLAELPWRSVNPIEFAPASRPDGFPSSSLGLSDIRLGVKYSAVSADRAVVTMQARVSMPTGDAGLGRGTDHGTIEPALLFWGAVSDRFAVEGMVGDSIPLGGSAGLPTDGPDDFSGNVFFWGIGPSYEVYRRGATTIAPVVEFVGWHVLGGFKSLIPNSVVPTAPFVREACCGAVAADGTNIVNMKIGARIGIDAASSFYVGYGRALTDAVWYSDIGRFEYRYTF